MDLERAIVVVLVLVVAGVASRALGRRRPSPPTQAEYQIPAQLDRADFDGADKPWLVALFTSATCGSCHEISPKAHALSTAQVAVHEVEYGERRDLHDRYSIEVVPLLLVADGEGVVKASFIGNMSATDLWAAVAEARDPGSSPEPGLGQRS